MASLSQESAEGTPSLNAQVLSTPGDPTTFLKTMTGVTVLRLAKHKVLYKTVPTKFVQTLDTSGKTNHCNPCSTRR